jgi:hypothetical protein
MTCGFINVPLNFVHFNGYVFRPLGVETRSRLILDKTRAVESESESEGILGGVGVGKNLPTPTPTAI